MKEAWKGGFCELVDGFIVPRRQPVSVSAVDAGLIEKWAKAQLKSIGERQANNPSKICTINLQDIVGIVKASWGGDGCSLDVTGATFTLDAASMDRRDSKQGYTPGNVRVMHWGLNRLKSACVDD